MADKPGILVALGMGPKSSPSSQPPSSVLDRMAPRSSQSAPPTNNQAPNNNQNPQAGQKISRDQAGYIPDDQCCGGCVNFTKETGECSKVEGVFEPCDKCKTEYVAANTTGVEDEDDMNTILGGGAPPNSSSGGGQNGGFPR